MTQEERQERAPHISSGPGQVLLWQSGEGSDFRTAELSFYRERYGGAIEATNERYRRAGHPERCRSVEQVYTAAQTRPEEVILQIGDRNSKVDREIFRQCVDDYLETLRNWSEEHGGHLHILNAAIHFDETSPHAHIRRVWDYTDKDGFPRLGQNKALELSGIPLKDPGKPQGRYNNRKIVFDEMMREEWQEIAQAHGFEIETEPRTGLRHKNKAEFIAEQLRLEREELEQKTAAARADYEAIRKAAAEASRSPIPETVTRGIGRNRREVVELSPDEYMSLRRAANGFQATERELKRQRDDAERRARQYRDKASSLRQAVEACCSQETKAQIMAFELMTADERRRILETDKQERKQTVKRGRER